MNSKAIKWGCAILVVVFIFLWITVYIENPEDKAGEQVPVATVSTTPSTPKYVDPSGFSVSYPTGYTVSTSSDNALFAKGVSFLVPEALTAATNLSPDSRLYIEGKLGTSTCSELVSRTEADASPGSMEETVSFGENKYRAVTYSEAGAGNFYETDVYALQKGNICYEISRFIHTTNIANYEAGTVTAFDRSALDAGIKQVLETFTAN